jgi:hypothetical protein
MGPPTKKEAFLDHLSKLPQVYVRIDARREGVEVPPHLKDNPVLALVYGLDMPVPIDDLVANDDGIAATLSFGRTPHKTFVPWPAIYIIGSEDRGIVYKADIPKEVEVMPLGEDAPPLEPKKVPTPLSVMEGGGESRDDADVQRPQPALSIVK